MTFCLMAEYLLERVNGYQFEKLANDLENAASLPYDVAI